MSAMKIEKQETLTCLMNYVSVMDELDKEALDPKWFDEYYDGFDEEKKCPYCGNGFDDPQYFHLTCGM